MEPGTFVCKFDIDTEGRFVQGSLPEVTMKLLKNSRAHIKMPECTLTTKVEESKISVTQSAVGHRLCQL